MRVRRRTTTALSIATLAALAAPLGAGAAHAAGAAGAASGDTGPGGTPAPFRLSMPSVVKAYAEGHGRAYTETGPRIVAGAEDLELRATRASYDQPIVVRWMRPGGVETLPSDTMTGFDGGLPDFIRMQVRDAKGKLRSSHYLPFCPGDDTQRVEPGAVAHNPYPDSCPYNPYTLGSVSGVPAGWATSAGDDYTDLELGLGTYTLTTQITTRYRPLFHLDQESDYRKISTLKVVKDTGYGGGYRSEASHSTAARPGTAARPVAAKPSGVSGTPAGGPAPDLRSLPAWGLRISGDGNYLQFAATVWNGGTSPMVVDGYRGADTDADHLDAFQYFFDKDGNQTGYQPVGSMEWDPRPSHHHWHFEDFARYTLVTPDGGLAVKSQKEAFCLANTDAVDYTLPEADWHPDGTDLGTACGDHDSLAVRESLATGSGDTYDQSRAGQSFDLRKVANGTYLVRIEANPGRNLIETDTTNNVSDRRVTIGGKSGHRTVKVAKVGLVDEDAVGFGGF